MQRAVLLLLKLLEMRLHDGTRAKVTVGTYFMLQQYDFWIVVRVTSVSAGLLMKEVMALYDWRHLIPHAGSMEGCERMYYDMYSDRGGQEPGARWDVYGVCPVEYSLRHVIYFARRNIAETALAGSVAAVKTVAMAKTKRTNKKNQEAKPTDRGSNSTAGMGYLCTNDECRILMAVDNFCGAPKCGKSCHPGENPAAGTFAKPQKV